MYFLGKPLKPEIKGNVDVLVKSATELTCSSASTSAPEYYAKVVKLSYKWFVNISKEVGQEDKLRISHVEKYMKYNQYSCTATERGLESDQSNLVQINPLCKSIILMGVTT